MGWINYLRELFNIVWSPRCLVCDRRLAYRQLCSRCTPPLDVTPRLTTCVRCAQPLTALESPEMCAICRITPSLFRYQRYLWSYTGIARRTIRIIKYRPSRRLCILTAAKLGSLVPILFPNPTWDLIVPMPARPASLRRRGFNQCTLIAREITRATHIPLAITYLQQRGSVKPQASLRHSARVTNVTHTFHARSSHFNGRHVLLIDDVCTTGATSAAAAQALLAAGAASVDLFTLARAAAWAEYRAAIRAHFGPAIAFSGNRYLNEPLAR